MGGKNILCKRQHLLENPDTNDATVHPQHYCSGGRKRPGAPRKTGEAREANRFRVRLGLGKQPKDFKLYP